MVSQRCAVCQISDGMVTNIIIADPAIDQASDGCTLVALAYGMMCDIGWIWDGSTFTDPNPPPQGD